MLDQGVDIHDPPAFEPGDKVAARRSVRNDGTFPGVDRGVVLVEAGAEGYVRSVGTFLNRFYVYGVDFVEAGMVVGMRRDELVGLDL
ncbi:MAG: nitrogen fixation protein NifZ [Actinomycetota bacterium]